MIVDIHTHVWDSPDQLGPAVARRVREAAGRPWERVDASVTALGQAMQTVQYAVILGLESRYLGASIPIQQVARCVADQPDKYLGFAGIDPMQGGFLDQVDQAMALGLVGVAISPAAQDFHPSHTRAMRLYEKCVALKLPIVVSTGTHFAPLIKMEYGQPHLWDEVARTFPELRLVISELGNPWLEQTLYLIGKHEHVYADLSFLTLRPWQLYNALIRAHEYGVINRVLFGSDFPFSAPTEAIVTIYSVNTFSQGTHLPSIPREQLRGIVERDALACLGIAVPQSADRGKGGLADAAQAGGLLSRAPTPAPGVDRGNGSGRQVSRAGDGSEPTQPNPVAERAG